MSQFCDTHYWNQVCSSFETGSFGVFLAQWVSSAHLAEERTGPVPVSLLICNSAAYDVKQELKFLERFFLFLILMAVKCQMFWVYIM